MHEIFHKRLGERTGLRKQVLQYLANKVYKNGCETRGNISEWLMIKEQCVKLFLLCS